MIIDWLVSRDVIRKQRIKARETGRILGLPTAGYQIALEKSIKEFLKLRYAPLEMLERLTREAEHAGNTAAADMLRGWAQEAACRSDLTAAPGVALADSWRIR